MNLRHWKYGETVGVLGHEDIVEQPLFARVVGELPIRRVRPQR